MFAEAGVDGRVDSGVVRDWEGVGVGADVGGLDGIGSLDSDCTAFSSGDSGGGYWGGSDADWSASAVEEVGEFLSITGTGG